MKIETIPMRTVTYFGTKIQIPAHHTAIAVDASGMVHSFEAAPKLDVNAWKATKISLNNVHLLDCRMTFDKSGEWRDSLQIYPLDYAVQANKVTAAAHPHAELMMEYAKIAQTTDKPWEHFEVWQNDSCVWKAIHLPVRFYSHMEYRLKPEPPKTIRIGEYDVPEPVREPLEDDKEYWGVDPMAEELAWKYKWNNALFCNLMLRRGLIHLTKEAAVIHAKALLSLTKAAD